MVRILTKQLVDGKEVAFQIAHQSRNIIDCESDSDQELETKGKQDQHKLEETTNQDKKLTRDTKSTGKIYNKRNRIDIQSDSSDEMIVSDQDSDREADYVNQTSREIKAAIKYKLIDNLYWQYLGVHIPFNKVINSSGNIHKEGVIDRR